MKTFIPDMNVLKIKPHPLAAVATDILHEKEVFLQKEVFMKLPGIRCNSCNFYTREVHRYHSC
jgi:hypothetical protein